MFKKNTEYKWFREAGIGMFIHWGVYSVIGRGEWVKFQEQIPLKEYDKNISGFTAENYAPDEWAKLAKNAGMHYMVLTAKHHDGFCLFDTATTNRNAVKQGPKRDLVKHYVDACRKHGLKVGLYFSWPDWSIPAFFTGPDKSPEAWRDYIDFTREQVRELCSNYGQIDILWYDKVCGQSGNSEPTAEDLCSYKLNKMVRELQPQILINDRSLLPEDFYTAEQNIKAPDDTQRIWEACLTMNKHWGYFPADDNYKSAAEIIHLLTGIAYKRGNMLLNIGPAPDGTIRPQEVERLKSLGKWMAINGESVRNVEPCMINGGTYGCSSVKADTVYVYVHWWHGNTIKIADCDLNFDTGVILGTNNEVKICRDGKHIILKDLPQTSPDQYCTVIKLHKV
jgi:alpha-L-fucosidase